MGSNLSMFLDGLTLVFEIYNSERILFLYRIYRWGRSGNQIPKVSSKRYLVFEIENKLIFILFFVKSANITYTFETSQSLFFLRE